MTTWREPDNENLPYRASIDDGVYQRCGDMYNSYFEDLESIGPLNTRDDASVSAKESGRKIKVGAKPLSGVRGIYYTRGTWRVQYRGNGQDIVSCVFNYDTKEVLIATFDLAFKLLRRVIKLGRHIKKEDGMIIGELTEDRLLDLDRRSRLRTSKQNGGCSKDSTPLSCKRVTRPRYDFDSDDNESEADYSHSPVCKKTRPSCEKISPQSCGVGSDIAVAPNMNYYVGKLSSFERRFQSYGNIATHALISFLIDEGCMRNSEIRGAGRRGDLYFSNEMGNDNLSEKGEPPSRDTYTIESPELYPPQVPRSTSLDGLDALYNQNTDRAQLEVEDTDLLYHLQPSMPYPITALPSGYEYITYDNLQIPQRSFSGDEASPYTSPDRRIHDFDAPPTEADTTHNGHGCFDLFYGHDVTYPQK